MAMVIEAAYADGTGAANALHMSQVRISGRVISDFGGT